MPPLSHFQSTSSAHSGLSHRTRPRYRNKIGSEPGINPRAENANEKYSDYQQECVIQVADFSNEIVALRTMSNPEFVDFIKKPAVKADDVSHKPPLRWINVGGISWDVLSALALQYDLHSLAIEDILQEGRHHHSKADYYPQHLFLRVLCHSLQNDAAVGRDDFSVASTPRHSDVEHSPASTVKERSESKWGLFSFRSAARQQHMLRIAALTKGDRVVVNHEPMYIFLLREGTVISIHPTPDVKFTAPVMDRLHQHDSVLRSSEDPALLVEAILDLVVDRILEILESYQDKIIQLENDILLKPGMSTVRSLHILSGDLILNKRTMEPIKTLIYGLRQYDQDRFATLRTGDRLLNRKQLNGGRADADIADPLHHGYMSYQAKIYLADVQDHIDFVLTSLDIFAGISENLISYAFNMASYEMNQVMQRLTLATIIFLPLTLLTGYFGMNFASMDSVQDHSELLFWIIALPVMGVVVPLFLYTDILSAIHYAKKVMVARKAVYDKGDWAPR